MSTYHQQLTQAVTEKFAKEGADLAFAPALAKMVADRTHLDGDGRNVRPVMEIIEEVRAEFPEFFSAFKPASSQSQDSRSKLDKEMDAARATATADRLARADALAQAGNPWRPNTRNLTAQAIIANVNPDLAARLKAEAGARV